jgi:apolipoprotein N-acyltransferase
MKHILTFVSVYGWLIFAMVFLFLASGDRPVEIAVWLSPLLLLRFFHEVKLWLAILITLPCMTAIILLGDMGMMPFPMSIAIVLTIINSGIALIPYIMDRILRQSLPVSVKTLLFPFSAVAAEFLLASQFTGGTWGNPAYGINNMPLLQLVSVTGIWGLMFLIYWTASIINEIWEHRSHIGDIRGVITAFLAVFIVVYGSGLWRLNHEKPAEQTVRVAGITPGPEYRTEIMEIFGKIFSSSRTGVFDAESIRTSIEKNYQKLLTESIIMARSGAEIVTWSEGATLVFESDEEMYIQQAVLVAQAYDFYLGMGIVVLNDSCQNLLANNQPFAENKLLFIAPDGSVVWEYSKTNTAPGYETAMTILGDGNLKLSNTAKGKVTGAICYDLDFPQYIRQAGMMKSDLLLAPSNDWPEIKNTHAGKIVSYIDDFESNGAPIDAVLPMGSVQTLYSTLGDFWTWICVFGGFILIVLGIVRRWKR